MAARGSACSSAAAGGSASGRATSSGRSRTRRASLARSIGAIQIDDGFSLVDVHASVADHVVRGPPRRDDPGPQAARPLRPLSATGPACPRRRAFDDPSAVARRPSVARIERVFPRGAILLSVLSLAYFATGIVRNRVFANTYGAGAELDAYNAAFRIPEIALDVLVAAGLTAPFVPIYSRLRHDEGDDRSGQRLRADGADRARSA